MEEKQMDSEKTENGEAEIKELKEEKLINDERKKEEENEENFDFENISEELLSNLLSTGFSEIQSLNALHFTKSESMESALQWLEKNDKDNEFYKISEIQNEHKPKLTKEEAKQKAYELQKRIRQQRIEREKKEETEREKNRIKSMKMMKEQQEKFEEEERKRNLYFLKKEKLEYAKEKEIQKQLLKKDWEERFEKPYPEDELVIENNIKMKSAKDQIIFYCSKLRKTYKNTNKEGLKTCLNTLKLYFKNAYENPTNKKYHSIKKDNNVFKSRLSSFDGVADLIIAVGFIDDGDSFAIKGYPDGYLLGIALKYIELILSQL